MTPPDETLAWTDAQLEFEIARHTDLDFVCEWLGEVWSARIERHSEGAVEVLHAATHIDRRMALYDIYGLIWLSIHPRPAGASVWNPNVARPTNVSVARYVQSKIKDPEDLDPHEVAAVYGIPPSQRS